MEKEITKIAVQIIRYNHGQALPGENLSARQIMYNAAKLGFKVEPRYNGELYASYTHSENAPLNTALETLTASRKTHPTPKADRERRKEAEQNAEWYNIRRYTQHWPPKETWIAVEARRLRHLATAHKYQEKAGDIVYWANTVAEADTERKAELIARMNHPEQVTYNLKCELCTNRYTQELPF